MVPGDLHFDINLNAEHYWLQIEQASRGCVSGTLAEWPHLYQALLAEGVVLPKDTHHSELRRICLELVKDKERRDAKFGG
jgi:hypothetical protein